MTGMADACDVFVGRAAELKEFAALLDALAGDGKAAWWSKPQAAPPQPRVLLIHASGGMGKSELLRQFGLAAEAHPGRPAWVLLNWDDEHDAERLPDDFPALLVRLYNTLAEHFGLEARKAFRDFANTHARRGEVEAQVEQARSAVFQEFVAAAGQVITGAAVPALTTAAGLPPNPAIEKLLAVSVDYGVQVSADQLARLSGDLQRRLQRALSKDDYRLYTEPNDAYAAAFVAGLTALADRRPLILAQDTYEWISSRPSLDNQWRAMVVKPVVKSAARLALVMAGRDALGDEYARSFQPERRLLRVMALPPFSADETGAFLSACGLPASLGPDFQRKTLGVPLAVGGLIAQRRAGGDEAGAPWPDAAEAEDERDVIRLTTERFLRYLFATRQDSEEAARKKAADRYHVYTLALLRTDDARAQATCWAALESQPPLSLEQVAERRQALRRRNEFLFERHRDPLQKEVRHFVRAMLWQQTRANAAGLEAEVVRQLNTAALAHYQAALAEREKARPALDDRLADAEWRSLCLNELNHLFWQGEREGLQGLCRRLLEAGHGHGAFSTQLVQLAAEAGVSEPPGLLSRLEAGAQTLLQPRPDLATLAQLWDAVAEQLDGRDPAPKDRALLALHCGRALTALDKTDEAVTALTAGLAALPTGAEPELRALLLIQMVGAAAVLALQQHRYQPALEVAGQVLRADPGNLPAENVRVIALLGSKAYDEAWTLLDRLTGEHPEAMEFWWARQTLFNLQGRDAEGRAELVRIAKERPQFAQHIARAVIEQGHDRETLKATMEWGEDAGWSRAQAAGFNRLVDALKPEVLAELIAAQLNLMAAENPTAEQVVGVRELFVRHLPDWPEAQAELGAAYVAAGRLPEAEAAFERAQALAPDNPAVYTVPGLLLYWGGHRAEALPHLERSAALLPDNHGPELMIIDCLVALGRGAEAVARAEAALQRFPEVGLLRWSYGNALIATDQPGPGLRELRAAYRADPNLLAQFAHGLRSLPAWALENFKAQVLNELGSEIGAVLIGLPFADLTRLYVELVRARLNANDAGEPDPALLVPVLEELLAISPGTLALRLELAHALEAVGDLARAAELLEAVVETASPPARDSVRHTLARLYFDQDDRPNCLRHLRRVEAPLGAGEYRVLANLLAEADEYRPAVEAYDKALALEDDADLDRLSRFGVYNRAVDRPDRAEALLHKLLERQPDTGFVSYHLAEIYFSQGRYAEAQAAGEKALALAPEAPAIAAGLARIYQALGLAGAEAVQRQRALQLMHTLEPYDQACVLAALGLEDEALARLAEAFRAQPGLRGWAAVDPDLRELRAAVQALAASPT